MGNKVIIIGAGIAGLSAGCYLQMNGYDTEIYELHSSPGGLCTSWKRQDYTIDGCIHWLVGSSPHDNFYRIWDELIAMKDLTFVDFDEYIRVEDRDGRCMRVFTDLDKLEAEMLEKAPEDRKVIIAFTRAIRKLSKLKMPIEKAPETYSILDGLTLLCRFLPYLGLLKKWSGISAHDYAEKCTNALLKKTFECMFIPEMSALFLVMTMAWMNKKSAGYPIGGSLKFAGLLEKKYVELGGTVNYQSRVVHILTENDCARGIILERGQTHQADIVISAADGHTTIFEMLGGQYVDKTIRRYYDTYETFPSYIQVSLGVSRTLNDVPPSLFVPLEKPLLIDEDAQSDMLELRIFNFDPTLAPEGKTVITSMFPTRNTSHWVNLRNQDRDRYRAEKERIALEVIAEVDRRLGNIKEHVEMIDVSTPATVIRYTNNWKGSFEGWILTPKIGLKPMKKTLPGLAQFYLVGQWVEPGGGLPTALLSGRNVTQIICKNDNKKFRTITN